VNEVEVQRARVELGRVLAVAGGEAMPQRYPQPGVELARAERLGHVVVGAVVQRLDLAVLRAVRRQHDDRRVAPAADAVADLEPVKVGQAEVEDDQVRGAGGRLLEPSSPVSAVRTA
jgi:hypothetical protein